MKKINKKLQLNKETIARLENPDKIKGGVEFTKTCTDTKSNASYCCPASQECSFGATQCNPLTFQEYCFTDN